MVFILFTSLQRFLYEYYTIFADFLNPFFFEYPSLNWQE